MNDAPKTPLIFANKVIHVFVDHLLGRGVEDRDCMVMRMVFNRCGGEWTRIGAGDPVHLGLLMRIVKAWGKAEKKDA